MKRLFRLCIDALLFGLFAALVAWASGCIEQTNLTSTGPTGGLGGSVSSSAIENLRILPSQFELANGERATAVVVGSIGGVEVRDFDFVATIAPNRSVATIESIAGNVIVFKAENPGNTELRVTAGRAEAEATIRVLAAN